MTQNLKFLSALVVVACATMMFAQSQSHSARLKAYTAVLYTGAGTPANIRALSASSTLPCLRPPCRRYLHHGPRGRRVAG
jgi:hypothetical protein